MAKIDTTQIENFDNMTAEQKLEAVLGLEIPDQTKLKKAMDAACSDAAEWKRKYRETQSESERIAAETAEKYAALEAENKAYRERERIATYQAKLMGAGYDEQTARVMAGSLHEGIDDTFFAAQKAFLDTQRQKAVAEELNKQPSLSVGSAPSSANVEDQTVAAFRRAAGLK